MTRTADSEDHADARDHTAVQDRAAVRIPPPFIPMASIFLGLGLQRVVPLDVAWLVELPGRVGIGIGLIIFATLVLIVWPGVLFHRTGQKPEPWKPTTEIVAAGPYHLTRNPMYLGMLIVCVGFAVVLGNLWIVALLPLTAYGMYHFAIRHEEAYLERKFGEEYLSYRRSVRRWL